jgi:hypothetical protein
MADHFDAPGFSSPDGDSRIDITDHYVFQSPADPGTKTVFVLDVNPLASADSFRSDAVYQTLIDTDDDLAPEITFQYTFTPKDPATGAQFATVTRTDQNGTVVLFPAAPVSFGSTPIITTSPNGVSFFAGLRSEPFFFDTVAFINNMSFTNPGTDFFLDKNVYGIVLEVPNAMAGPDTLLQVETLTQVPSTYNPLQLIPADQMGRPLVNTFYNSGNDENTFNQTPPAHQRAAKTQSGQTFLQSFTSTLQSWGRSYQDARQVALWLLPDILQYQYSKPAHYPYSGRKLQDDTATFMLNQLTNGQKPSDYVPPHTDYLSAFPYLGNPH